MAHNSHGPRRALTVAIPALLLTTSVLARQPAPAPGEPLPAGALARLGTTQLRALCDSIHFAADGKTLVGVNGGHLVRVWDAANGALLATRPLPRPPEENPWAIRAARSADGNTLLVCKGSALEMWDIPSGKRLDVPMPQDRKRFDNFTLTNDRRLVLLVETVMQRMNPEGAGGGFGRLETQQNLLCWDTTTSSLGLVANDDHAFGALAISPDGQRLASSSSSWSPTVGFGGELRHQTRVWDVGTGKVLWQDKKFVTGALAYTPDGRHLIANANGGNLWQVWDAATGEPSKQYRPPTDSYAWTFAISPDGTKLLSPTVTDYVLWDLSAGRVLHRWPGAHQAGKVACAPDGRSVVTSDTILRHWDVATGRPLYADVGPLGHVKSVRRLFFTPDGQRLASVGLDGTIRVWDVPGAKPVHTINIGDTNLNTGILPSEGALLTWTLTPDGANLIAVDDRLNIHRWSVADGQPRPGFQLKEARDLNIRSRARQIRVAPDGQTLAVTIPPGGYDRLRYSFSSWDLKTGRLRSWGGDVERGFNGEYSMLSPDVRWAAERGKLYDTQTGRQVLSLPGGGQQRYVIGEVFSPDSRLLAEPAENLRVWEIATGGLLIDVPGTDTTLASFSPDGRRFAYADRSRLVVWDLPTRKLVLERPAPELLRRDGWVTGGVAFAPDGRTVATGHRDGTILIWEVPPVEEVRLSERELAALWNDLADDSPAQAYAAVWRLGQDPDAAARFLGQMPRPVVLPTDAEWRALIRNLNSDRFAEREAASRRLRELGRAAEDVLRQSLKDKPTPEQQRRIEVLLAALNPAGPPQGDNLRAVRAVAVLENINTAAARQVLTRWAEQSPNPWLAGEASRALARQKWRPVLGTRR